MSGSYKEFYHKIKTHILFKLTFRPAGILLVVLFITKPFYLLSQVFPDTILYKKALNTISNNYGQKLQSKKPEFRYMRLSNSKSDQCISVSSVTNEKVKKKLLIFWQKDSSGRWVNLSSVISAHFGFTDIDKDGINEIECIDKENYKYHREKNYRLISFKDGSLLLMYSYHQYEYYNSTYIMNNFAFDSVFSVKHNLLFSDINNDHMPELVDNIEIKYRKQPCCDPHLEYGIREKKLVLRLINGKFELN